MIPEPGQIVAVRQRRYLVEKADPRPRPDDATLVHLGFIQDDARGQPFAVLWEHEQNRSIISGDKWGAVAANGCWLNLNSVLSKPTRPSMRETADWLQPASHRWGKGKLLRQQLSVGV